MAVKELDVVALIEDLPMEGLAAGDRGTVVHIFHTPDPAYEVEFVDRYGATFAMATLKADQFRVIAQ